MSTTPETPHDPPQGGFPPPPQGSAPGYGPPGPPPGPGHAGPPPGPGHAGPPPGYGHAGPPPANGGGYPPGGSGGSGGPGGYGPAGPAPSAYGPGAPLSPADQRTWAIVSHLSGIFVSVIGPLVVWLVFRGRGAYLEDQAKEALNFQITLVIAYLVGGILAVIGIGFLIIFAAWIATILFAILAAVASSRGEPYRYPVALRLVS